MSFLIAMCCPFFRLYFCTFFALRLLGRLYAILFFISFLQKNIFCFLSYSPQRQTNSFRISGVHGILLSWIIPLYYIILRIECQVRIMLILFYYFAQHFITIFFAQHLTAIFLHVLHPYYNRKKLPSKIHFRRSKPLSYKVFCDHFSCALSHTNYKLIQLYHIIHLTFCQVKIV